jgi:hypothetical protein
MKILIIFVSHTFDLIYKNNLIILKNLIKQTLPNSIIDFCAISSFNDFSNYEDVIQLKYKVINSKKQLNKTCDFITDYKSYLNYDWYIKFRPDFKLLEPINFNLLVKSSINARARVYIGPKKIVNGSVVGGKGKWNMLKHYKFSINEERVILDDAIWIFDHNVINKGAFDKINSKFPEKKSCEYFTGYKCTFEELHEPELKYSELWKSKNIRLNVIGINILNEKHNTLSGNINI